MICNFFIYNKKKRKKIICLRLFAKRIHNLLKKEDINSKMELK